MPYVWTVRLRMHLDFRRFEINDALVWWMKIL